MSETDARPCGTRMSANRRVDEQIRKLGSEVVLFVRSTKALVERVCQLRESERRAPVDTQTYSIRSTRVVVGILHQISAPPHPPVSGSFSDKASLVRKLAAVLVAVALSLSNKQLGSHGLNSKQTFQKRFQVWGAVEKTGVRRVHRNAPTRDAAVQGYLAHEETPPYKTLQ